jgi:flagellar basal body-associated protein FliL
MNENADNNRSGLKIFLVALLLILTVSIPTTIYFYINPPELTFIKRLFNPPQNTYTLNPSEREQFPALAKDSDELNVVRQDTSLSNVQKYLRGIEERSETANTEREQETLALRTAIFLSLNRDKNTTQNFQKATDIFVDLINTNQGTDATTTYYRNFAKIGLAWLNVQCCDSETVNPYLFTKKIDGYTFTYKE